MCYRLQNSEETIPNIKYYLYVGRIYVGIIYVVDINAPLHVFCLMKRKPLKAVGKGKSPEITQLAERIRELRIARGYKSGEAFALDHQLSRTHYGRWERGANITFSNLVKLAEAFNVSLEEFFSQGFK